MSIQQSYIDRINANTAAANALNVDDFIEDAKKKNATKKQADIDLVNSGYDAQISNTQESYEQQMNDATASYANEYERNAVQKLINEKRIAERNANLGLADSGLNRTQQTASQLSYANQKSNIDLARQKTLDALELSLTSAITSLQNEKASSVRNIENQWDDLSSEQGINAYNSKLEEYKNQITADSDALTNIYKAQNSALSNTAQNINNSYILKTSGGLLARDFSGSLADNNVDVIHNINGTTTYIDNNSGKKSTFDSVVNPFTGTINKDAKNGVFSNGYQPNNINGVKLKTEEKDAIRINNQLQSVFKCGDKYYAWDGKYNEYFEVVMVDLGNGKHRWEEK